MFWKISQGIREIGEHMIAYPKDWFQTEYDFICKSNPDIQVWTANGVFGCKLMGHDGLSWFERRYLMDCVAKSKADRLKLSTPSHAT